MTKENYGFMIYFECFEYKMNLFVIKLKLEFLLIKSKNNDLLRVWPLREMMLI